METDHQTDAEHESTLLSRQQSAFPPPPPYYRLFGGCSAAIEHHPQRGTTPADCIASVQSHEPAAVASASASEDGGLVMGPKGPSAELHTEHDVPQNVASGSRVQSQPSAAETADSSRPLEDDHGGNVPLQPPPLPTGEAPFQMFGELHSVRHFAHHGLQYFQNLSTAMRWDVACHRLKLLDVWCAYVWWCSTAPLLTPPLCLFVNPCFSFTTHYLGVARGVQSFRHTCASRCVVRTSTSKGGWGVSMLVRPTISLPSQPYCTAITRQQATFTHPECHRAYAVQSRSRCTSDSSDGTLFHSRSL